MSSITVTIPDGLSDEMAADALRRIADRLLPLAPPAQMPVEVRGAPELELPMRPPVRGRSRPRSGPYVESSSAGHLAACSRCSWRRGPFTNKSDAATTMASHMCGRNV